eukprot:42365_1
MSSHFTLLLWLVFLSNITFSQSSPNITCYYGYFKEIMDQNSTNYGKCAFNCFHYLTNGTQITTQILKENVTFDMIINSGIHSCLSDVPDEFKSNNCSTLDDLIWPDNCMFSSCPYCPCYEPPSTTKVANTTTYFTKRCTECECNIRNNKNETGWECNPRYYVNNPFEWDNYICTDNTVISCTDNSTGQTYTPGYGYWLDPPYVNGPYCQTYCYCNFDGTIDCENTYTDILNSQNTQLTKRFREECGSRTAGCFNNVTLMHYNDSGSCDCPICKCPVGNNNLGDIFYQEFTHPSYYGFRDNYGTFNTSCVKCECGNYGNGILQQNCNIYDDDDMDKYKKGTRTCPQQVQAICVDGYSQTGLLSNATVVNSTECYSTETQHCGWSFQIGDNPQYQWGCQHSVFCDAFTDGQNGSCFHLYAEVIYTDCQYSIPYTLDGYIMCCKGNNCNNVDVNISKCVDNLWANEWYAHFAGCHFGPDSPEYMELFCTGVEKYTCTDIQRIGTLYYGCRCSAYQSIFNRTTTLSQQFLIDDLERQMTGLTEWVELFNCSIDFTCDLNNTGLIEVNGVKQSPLPTKHPSQPPTMITTSPSNSPSTTTFFPSQSPTIITTSPSNSPSSTTTFFPSKSPSIKPSNSPSTTTFFPSQSPTIITTSPSNSPSQRSNNTISNYIITIKYSNIITIKIYYIFTIK